MEAPDQFLYRSLLATDGGTGFYILGALKNSDGGTGSVSM